MVGCRKSEMKNRHDVEVTYSIEDFNEVPHRQAEKCMYYNPYNHTNMDPFPEMDLDGVAQPDWIKKLRLER